MLNDDDLCPSCQNNKKQQDEALCSFCADYWEIDEGGESMMLPKNRRVRDRRYLDSFRDTACFACGLQDGTVVAAHIRHGMAGGISLKPDDSLTLPLCGLCHSEQGRMGEFEFWTLDVHPHLKDAHMQHIKNSARSRYLTWKEKQ